MRTFAILTAAVSIFIAGCATNRQAGKPEPIMVAAHLTDIHFNVGEDVPQRFQLALRHIRAAHPEVSLYLTTGDNVDGKPNAAVMAETYAAWNNITEAELNGVPLRVALGNHDYDFTPADSDAPYGKTAILKQLDMPAPYYSFDHGGWHFIVLDGTAFGGDKAQQEWLDQQLDSVNPKTPIAILSHQAVFSMSTITYYPNDLLVGWKALIGKLINHPNVKLCLSGHTHLYDRSCYNGVTYVCGGAFSGSWWDKTKAFHETWAGYGIVKFYADGSSEYEYYPLKGIVTNP